MNIVWTIIMLASIAALIFINPDAAATAMTKGANSAVSLSLTLLASYALWLGLFTLIEKTGLSDKLSKALKPVIGFLFPGADSETKKFIAMNVAANFLGLGNAATPMGISAVSSMYDGNKKANDNMIMFLVLSSTSLQLLPSTVIAMRISHGSIQPTTFLPACIIATVLSTFTGVLLVKIHALFKRKKSTARRTAKI